jgi:tetratricopeptide (TPR) repeat protein
LGAVARAQGEFALARSCYDEKLAFWRQVGDRTQAQALFEEVLVLRRELGDGVGMAGALAHLGDLASARGDHDHAAQLYEEALALPGASGDRAVAALCLEGMAVLAMAAGQAGRAARLYGAAASQRRGIFVLNVWDEPVARDRRVAAVREALGEEAFAAAWAAGQAMTPEEAVAAAQEDGAGG